MFLGVRGEGLGVGLRNWGVGFRGIRVLGIRV